MSPMYFNKKKKNKISVENKTFYGKVFYIYISKINAKNNVFVLKNNFLF